jgi:hypothetical protein
MISTSSRSSTPRSALARVLMKINQFQHVRRRGRSLVDDEVSMHGGNDRPAAARAFEAQFIDQFSGGNGGGWVFENAAGARLLWVAIASAFG